MKNIILIKINIIRFKGIDNLEINFENGGTNRSVSIFGANHVGKSTVSDAFSWLMFDKNSSNVQTFSIQPLNSDGKLKYPGADTSVEAFICVNDELIMLRKVYREVWTQKRGAVDRVMTGHTTDYYIDDVPRKKSEYDLYIKSIVNENVFLILTNLHMFAAGIKDDERRNFLIDMCKVSSDAEIASNDTRFSVLYDKLIKYSIEDIVKLISSQRKKTSADKSDIPKCIDTLTDILSEAASVDYSTTESDIAKIDAEIESLQTELLNIKNDKLSGALHNDSDKIANSIAALKIENDSYRASHMQNDSEYCTQKQKLKSTMLDAHDALSAIKRNIIDINFEYETVMRELLNAREFYNKAGDTSDEYCPTCSRILDPDKIADIRSKKEILRAEIHKKGKMLSEKADMLRAKITESENRAAEQAIYAKSSEDSYNALVSPNVKIVEDMPGYQEKKAKLMAEKSIIDSKLTELETHSANFNSNITDSIALCKIKRDELSRQLSRRYIIDDTQKKIDVMRANERSLAAKIGKFDQDLNMCEEFIKYKVSTIEDSINSRFKRVTFKLFEIQLNGGINSVCRVMMDGKSYSDISTSEKIAASLDIINTLSNYYGIRVPLFVDNAESITRLDPANLQVVRLVVSETDKILRSEQYVFDSKKEIPEQHSAT